ncbi:MAG: thermonuclease family protein [Candidatus Staskawiczbacteria bacterium]|nr:thermonuclease family protein [Candidatus Staskawiczbacteria bacterium]
MAKKFKILLFLIILALILISVSFAIYFFKFRISEETKAPAAEVREIISGIYQITKVIDGDTIEVKIKDKQELVRLIGINTPEVDSPYTKEECFGPEASDYAKKLLDKKEVYLIPDKQSSDRDKYNRLLRYVFLPDGLFVNAEILKNGFAYNYIYEPFEFMKQFDFWEKEAKKNKIGLWVECEN